MEQLNKDKKNLMMSSLDNNFISNVNGVLMPPLSDQTFTDLHHHHHQRPQIPPLMSNNSNFINGLASFNPDHITLFQDPSLSVYSHQFLPNSDGHLDTLNPISESEKSLINKSSNSSPPGFEESNNGTHKTYSYGGKKRKRNNEKEMGEKPREVVHVRARRGQATDSHSLAERLRREKINEKLRSLQDIVPGCYKTMGMAVMLDVIINYVRSLQNQIEFLSMKLSAASLFYDFNSAEMDAFEAMQGTNGYEAQVMERMVGEGYGGFPQFQSTWSL